MTDETNKSGALSPLKQAYLALEEMKSRVEALEQARHEPIAVIGIGCRFPGGANDPEQYWRLIIEGEDAVSDLPAGRWDFDRFYDPDPNAPAVHATGSFHTDKRTSPGARSPGCARVLNPPD